MNAAKSQQKLTYSEVIKRIEDLPEGIDKDLAFTAIGLKLIERADRSRSAGQTIGIAPGNGDAFD